MLLAVSEAGSAVTVTLGNPRRGRARGRGRARARVPAAKYGENLLHYANLVLARYPDCRVVVVGLLMRTDNYGGFQRSASWPVIVAAQAALADLLPDRVLLVDSQLPVPLVRVDSVHASAGTGGGYDVATSRIRDLWSQ